MFAWNHKRRKKDTILQEMYSDTLELDISFDVPVRRPALFSRETFNVPVRPMDAKGLMWYFFALDRGFCVRSSSVFSLHSEFFRTSLKTNGQIFKHVPYLHLS